MGNARKKRRTGDGEVYNTGFCRMETDIRDNISFIRTLKRKTKLVHHTGCVNTINWNSEGNLIVTGSDDCKANIWSGINYKLIQTIDTGHVRNIFCALFVPFSRDRQVVTLGMDGQVRYNEVEHDNQNGRILACTDHMVLNGAFRPFSSSVFLSSHGDGTVRLFDIRTKQQQNGGNTVVRAEGTVYGLKFDPLMSEKFVISTADPVVCMFDLRKINAGSSARECDAIARWCPKHLLKRSNPVSGIDYNCMNEIAINVTSECAYTFSVLPTSYPGEKNFSAQHDPDIPSKLRDVQTDFIQRYTGHCNEKTFLKDIAFMGNSGFVVTGSDCGNTFIWEKESGELVQLLESDAFVVNGVAPHPNNPTLAVCGMDHDAKIFEVSEKNTFSAERAKAVQYKNKEENQTPFVDDWEQIRLILQLAGRFRFVAPDSSESDDDNGSDEEETDFNVLAMELELIDVADELRRKGNRHFEECRFVKATRLYKAALTHLSNISPSSDEATSVLAETQAIVRQDLAICCLRTESWDASIAQCCRILARSPNDKEALLTRAKAYIGKCQFAHAKKDLDACLRVGVPVPTVADLLELYAAEFADAEKQETKEKEKSEKKSKEK
eukprot:TRINITY_DN2578_c0_g1_i1.p1 TRINITY_DN2578_c0_g1~~TRINITY_DN2578_c0_g1_i1.p1  ORF type:complete len:646 (+),score=79.97 TRINITY_DN2578_c0_g1_i1:113-1939(+)